MEKPRSNDSKINSVQKKLVLRIVACVAILAVGAGIMALLVINKKPPAEIKTAERPIQAEVVRVVTEDIQIYLTGFGQAEALNKVDLAPEVSGKVVEINPHLEVGEVIEAGQILFAIDPRDYQAAFDDARAATIQWETTVARLKRQFELEKKRLRTLQRSRELAKEEYQRVKKLFEVDQVGTRSGVEQAERAYNAAADQADQMEQSVALFPMRIKEAQSSLAAARARRVAAGARLERCKVRAPFTGRVEFVRLEQDQFVTPGQRVVTLADDSVMEIKVALSSEDVGRWLRFETTTETPGSWFSPVRKVSCRIQSTAYGKTHSWQGSLDRVVDFDPRSRTVIVAVRVTANQARHSRPEGLPLVSGMFCKVTIPGRVLPQAVALPRQAVSFENTVYRVVKGRLKTAKVKVVRNQGDQVYISSGLQPGDLVITTRLVNPIENSLVSYAVKPGTKGVTP